MEKRERGQERESESIREGKDPETKREDLRGERGDAVQLEKK